MGKVMYMRKGDVHTAPSNLPAVGIALNDCTWEQVRAISDAGVAANYFAVGDTKTITINGTVGATTFSNLTVDAFIIGIDHNSAKEGTGIHFQIGKISGVDAALCDSQYSMAAASSGYFHMHTSSNGGAGWKNADAYGTIMGNNGTPSAPASGTLMSALPADLLSVLKSVVKYADATATGSNASSAVVSSADYLWLLSEFEVFGVRSLANTYEQNHQAQYDYYKAGNSKKKYKYSATGTAVNWWLRSPSYNTAGYFCLVNSNGSISTSAATSSFGMAPAFAV